MIKGLIPSVSKKFKNQSEKDILSVHVDILSHARGVTLPLNDYEEKIEEKNVQKKYEDFFESAKCGNFRMFVDNQKSVKTFINDVNEDGQSLLYVSAMHGHYPIVQWLVYHGADVNFQDKKNGNSPLHVASILVHVSVVRFLVMSHGCQKDILNKYGETPSQCVAEMEKQMRLAFEQMEMDKLWVEYEEIQRFIHDPLNTNFNRFNMRYEEVIALGGYGDRDTAFKAFHDKKWANHSFEMRWELVMDFKKMGNDLNRNYRHLKDKAYLNDPNEWARALIYVYTMETPLYSRMNMDLRSDSESTPFKSYINALEGALRSLQSGMNGCKKDPRISIDKGTVFYRFSWMSDDAIRCFEKDIDKRRFFQHLQVREGTGHSV